ncbi:translation initiation factor eIF-2B epsilon subunit, GEF [Dispira simplex]|nr:translation initiation factor eIF-2B epsilon subunit, GEF [Dispira simplex]
MPPKKPKQPNIEAEEKLSAVVIADSFDQHLMPLTQTTPRCLLPLCNVPLLEYTFELLATAGVEEVFIFCQVHAATIRQYLAQSKWSKPHSPFGVRVIVSQEALSVGDVLRELDGKSLIRTDFILIYGDVVSNMNLGKALEKHRNRKTVDKNAIMTMVVKDASPNHPTRGHQEAVYITDGQTQQLLHYVPSDYGIAPRKSVPVSVELFEKHPAVQVRYDLMDCCIDICSVEVPALFTENFDYQDIRRDFVTGILGSEVLDSTFYLYPLTHEYGARVATGQLYDAISRDVIRRWVFPMVPDYNLVDGDQYVHKRNHVYQEPSVKLSRTAELDRNVVIGNHSQVGEHSRITCSVIGRNCIIGDNVVIDGAYLFDGTVVHSGSRIHRAVLGYQVTVYENTAVSDGCLLGDRVQVGPNITVPRSIRLSRYGTDSVQVLDHPNEELATGEVDLALVGSQGQGEMWVPSDDEDELEVQYMCLTALAADVAALTLANRHLANDGDGGLSDSSQDSMDELEGDTALVPEDAFRDEVEATLDRAFRENHAVTDTLLELKGLRFANNKSNHDIRVILLPKILDLVEIQQLRTSLTAVLKRWGSLVASVINSETDQADALSIISSYCLEANEHISMFMPCVKHLYDLDVVDEDILLGWYVYVTKNATDKEHLLYRKLQPLIDWLNEAEEDDSDEEDDDDKE